jgi:hypothetical protein
MGLCIRTRRALTRQHLRPSFQAYSKQQRRIRRQSIMSAEHAGSENRKIVSQPIIMGGHRPAAPRWSGRSQAPIVGPDRRPRSPMRNEGGRGARKKGIKGRASSEMQSCRVAPYVAPEFPQARDRGSGILHQVAVFHVGALLSWRGGGGQEEKPSTPLFEVLSCPRLTARNYCRRRRL